MMWRPFWFAQARLALLMSGSRLGKWKPKVISGEFGQGASAGEKSCWFDDASS
jgi:hypothetical protein